MGPGTARRCYSQVSECTMAKCNLQAISQKVDGRRPTQHNASPATQAQQRVASSSIDPALTPNARRKHTARPPTKSQR